MAKQFCQSCGMPLNMDEQHGTETDGSLSPKFCVHCYKGGEFTWPDATLDQMQTYCAGILAKQHWPNFMIRMTTKRMDRLERWRT
ncbi:MAG TPA: zinc ribbon domain-containing protein [Candidatus Saccharimonadales bacterium]|nr:zinc ribbon domain-containing protein [Candidatus Saccharimonadales bacterium]